MRKILIIVLLLVISSCSNASLLVKQKIEHTKETIEETQKKFSIGNFESWIDFNYAGEYNDSWNTVVSNIFSTEKDLTIGLCPSLTNFEFLKHSKNFDGVRLKIELDKNQFGETILESMQEAKGERLEIVIDSGNPKPENETLEITVAQANILKNINFKEKNIIVTSGLGLVGLKCSQEVRNIIPGICSGN